ncbi:PMP-22/EMP/MP20/Claudin superfamily-containing protein [Strongyloides ratti]|uniref:PMP-22/EMP/MP20/Claudin superfamily-containing protein n=1 Tax=Strongyloides ratti TaxID=34506 RepID=A0A090KVK4_STRRB|nr:PMP-22/EMP/MP20/Claudin superfamily-containing protein [Strongyloides ratti]CEF59900.1 PMP-22/EMP/MP20/Claudin superfamily-containing protein [Strongyloides ratti]
MMDSLEKTVELRGSQILNYERYHKMLWQRRLMAGATCATIVSIVIFIGAVFSPNWTTLYFRNTKNEMVYVTLGVWGEWRTIHVENSTVKPVPEFISYFPHPPKEILRLDDTDLQHYYRAQAVFCFISLILMFCNNGLAIYTFYHHRYIYKRLVACLHLVIAMSLVVTSEILINSVNEWNLQVAMKHSIVDWHYKSQQNLGLATHITWIVALIYFCAFCIFIVSSKKQKGSRAATAEFEIEDRPIHIGR